VGWTAAIDVDARFVAVLSLQPWRDRAPLRANLTEAIPHQAHCMNMLAPAVLLATGLVAQGPPSAKIPRTPVSTTDAKSAVIVAANTSPALVQPQATSQVPANRPARPMDPALVAHGTGLASRLEDPDLVLFDQPQPGGALWARGSNFKASFATDGWTFCARPAPDAPHNEPIRFHLNGAVVGQEAIAVGDSAPELHGQRVEYHHGEIVETIDVGGKSVEQSFVFARLPCRGELTLDLAADSSLLVRNTDAGIAFGSEHVDVSYAQAIAIDAKGERVPAETSFATGRITIRVPADFVQRAQLPLVIDPVVSSVHTYAQLGIGAIYEYGPDIAWDPYSQNWGLVFEIPFSYDDRDMYLQLLDVNMMPVGVPLIVDITYDVWQRPRVADLQIYSRFMVVAQVSVDAAGPYDICGRIFDRGARPVTLSPFVVEPAGANGGLYGDKSWPDVAGDASLAAPTFFTVVWEREYSPTDHDIHMRQVENDGTLRGTGPTLIDNSGAYDDYWPSISKSDGPDPYPDQRFVITWDRLIIVQPVNYATQVHAALVTWDGQIVPVAGANNFYVATRLTPIYPTYQGGDEGRPHVSTTTDGSWPGDGRRFSMIVFENYSSSWGIIGCTIDTDGNVMTYADLSLLANASGAIAPCVDCDGARFAVGYGLNPGATCCNDTSASMFAYDALSNQILAQESGVILGGTTNEEMAVSVASTYSSTGQRDPRCAFTYLTYLNYSVPSVIVEAASYDGLAPGSISGRASGNGEMQMYFSGVPAIGQSFTLTLSTNTFVSGLVAGFPATIAIPGDPCSPAYLGVDGFVVMGGDTYSLAIPANPAFVGAPLAFQGFDLVSGTCLGSIAISDTIDVTLQ
jgi:hypothetical protein